MVRINDLDTLKALGLEVGPMLNPSMKYCIPMFTQMKCSDIDEAQSIGVQGVPFFVFDNKYAVFGAQHVETFVKTLEKYGKKANSIESYVEYNRWRQLWNRWLD
jgi:hypothetical protein